MKIAFVGASGYGNVGDDTYPLVFRRQFPEAELVFFNSDLPRALPDDIQLLVMGGGGIIYNVGTDETIESRHFRCMKFYMDWAIGRGIPWGFLSCGVQFAVHRDAHFAVDLQPWVPYLQKASFITLRSPECVRIVAAITGRETGLQWFPDAAYLFRPSGPAAGSAGESASLARPTLTLIPTGLINPRNRHTQHMLRHFNSMDYEITWMNMGAPVDDEVHLQEALLREPAARIVRNPTPDEAFRQVGASRMVLSGRYHGMLFARMQGIPFYVPEDSPYKIRHENLQADPADARGHIQVLREFMAACP